MNQKINNISAISLVVTVIIAHILSNLPQTLLHSTNTSTGINIIYITILALIATNIVFKLYKRFPNNDILDISEFLAGPALKITLGIVFIIALIIISAFLLRNFSENLVNIYFNNIHFSGIILIFLIPSVIINKFGFKAIVRCNLIILPIVLVSLIIIFFSTIGYGEYQRMLPILGNGFNETFIFGSTNIFAFGGLFLGLLTIPYIENINDFKKISFSSIIISGIYLLLSASSLLILIPNISELESTLSIYLVAREVQFGTFFQRVDAIFVLIWMLSIFAYSSIILYYITYIFKKIFRLNHSKPLVYSFAFIILGVSLIPNNLVSLNNIYDSLYKSISLILTFGISIIILILAYFKKGKVNQNE